MNYLEQAQREADTAFGGELNSQDSGGDLAEILREVEGFIGRFVAYPSEHARTAHTVWIAHAWLMDKWDSTPRIMFASPEPGSGKTRALEVTEPLVPRAIHAVNATPAYLFRKVSDAEGLPTILYDEIDTVFGPKAKDNEDVRGLLNAGHRKGAMAGRCVTRGKIIETEELPAYCAVALAGLGDLPDTIMTRSVVIRMRRRAEHEKVEAWRARTCESEAALISGQLAAWASGVEEIDVWPEMPSGVEDRNADVWEALLTVADLAGEEWPKKARAAAVAFVAASKEGKGSLGIQLLTDLNLIFATHDRLATEKVIEELVGLPESPWGDLRGKPIDSRGLATRLGKYEIKSKQLRIGERNVRGYERGDFLDAWSRYLPKSPLELSAEEGATSATTSTTELGATKPLPDGQGFCSRCCHPGALDALGLCSVCDETLPDEEKERIAIELEAIG